MFNDPESRPVASFQSAVERGDVEAGLASLQQLQEASVESLLDQIQTALEEGRPDDAYTLMQELTDEYETRQQKEAEVVAKAETARDSDEVPLSKVRRYSEYVGQIGEMSLQRSELLMRVQLVLEAEQEESSDVISTIEDIKNAEQTISSETESIEQEVNDEPLPPSISVLGVTMDQQAGDVGQPLTLTARIENIGEETATGVSLSVTTPEEISVETAPELGSIEPREVATEMIEVVADEPGNYSVSLDVTSDNAGRSAGTTGIMVTEQDSGSDGPPPVVGEDPPQDLDGDGLYQDIDGDGEFTIGDVQVFFQNRNSDVVQNNPAAFNFDGSDPADVTIGDVQALFQQLVD